MMKTTLNIDERLMRQLKARAAHEGRTMTALVEEAIRSKLEASDSIHAAMPPLPKFRLGRFKTDISNRKRLYDLMEGRG
ncbi:MAG: ribbon-helix-helix protein, CopG family [Phycisphaeraceae bacterium]